MSKMNGNAPISEPENEPISCLKVGGNAPFYATKGYSTAFMMIRLDNEQGKYS
jgi:uncharacterized membrane protein